MKFEEFITLKIKDSNGKEVGYFLYENEQLYIVGLNKKIKFDIVYNEEYIPFYLSAAYQKLSLE